MNPHDQHLLILLAKKLSEKRGGNKAVPLLTEKKFKDMDGVEWTEYFLKMDWEKDRPAFPERLNINES